MTSFESLWRKYDFRTVADQIAHKDAADVERALGRGRGNLSLDDLAALLSPAAAPFLEPMAQISHQRTVERFGRTMQLYAPLYLSNVCGNICTYCGFSAQNRVERLILEDNAILAEAAALAKMGMQHVLLL